MQGSRHFQGDGLVKVICSIFCPDFPTQSKKLFEVSLCVSRRLYTGYICTDDIRHW